MTLKKKKAELVSASSIELIEGMEKRGKSGHDFYWHIYCNGVRAGQVYIDYITDPVLGNHAAINIFLNKKSQGKGIGRVGYRSACKKSGLETIYAHMRKTNIPSKKAALAAGFKELHDERFIQLVMVWKKSEQEQA